MTELLDNESKQQEKKNGKLKLIGFILLLVYAISSYLAMNDLWKFDVDQRYNFFFGDPMRYYNSGMTYLYISLAALLGSALMFFINIKKTKTINVKMNAVIAGILILVGFSFYFSGSSYEPSFMEYISANFYPYWSLTLAGLFIASSFASFLNKKGV